MKRIITTVLAVCILISAAHFIPSCSDRTPFVKPEKPVFSEEENRMLDYAWAEINKAFPETLGIDTDYLVPYVRYSSGHNIEEAQYGFRYYWGEFPTKAHWYLIIQDMKFTGRTETEVKKTSYDYGTDEIFNYRMTEKDIQYYKDQRYEEIVKQARIREKRTGGTLDIPDKERFWASRSPHIYVKRDTNGKIEYYGLGYQFFVNYKESEPNYNEEDIYPGVKIRIRKAG